MREMLDTKGLLISKTAEVMRVKGYHGTGLAEILKALELPKGSLYHHFPNGKDQLVEAALKLAAKQQADIYKKAMKGKGAPENGLSAVVDTFIETAEKTEYRTTCPVANVCLDISSTNSELRTVCQELFTFWIGAIASFLTYKNVEHATAKAEKFMVQLEGALLLTKVYQSNRYLELLKKDIPTLLDS